MINESGLGKNIEGGPGASENETEVRQEKVPTKEGIFALLQIDVGKVIGDVKEVVGETGLKKLEFTIEGREAGQTIEYSYTWYDENHPTQPNSGDIYETVYDAQGGFVTYPENIWLFKDGQWEKIKSQNLVESDKVQKAPNIERKVENDSESLIESEIDSFGERHPLDRLSGISEVSSELFEIFKKHSDLKKEGREGQIKEMFEALNLEEQEMFTIRITAKEELSILNFYKRIEGLRGKPSVNVSKLDELEAKYKKLSKAVGYLSGGKVDHDR